MAEQFLIRNVYNPKVVADVSKQIKQQFPAFKEKEFSEYILSRLDELSYNERISLITYALEKFLPSNFEKSAAILMRSLGSEIKHDELEGWDGFYVIPMTMYIARNGQEHFDLSMKALFEMTKRFSAEGAIRYFIVNHEKKTLQQLTKWAKHANPHVRRLASEGTRPRLPWTMQLKQFQKDPKPVLKILELLKEDPTLLIRRSVANNINDIGKDNPKIAIATLQQWSKINNPGTQWIIRHASRSLIKEGHIEALALLGYKPDPKITINNFKIRNEKIKIGQELEFSFDIISNEKKKENFMIDYIIHFMKANGKLAPKVFKLSKKTIKPKETISLSKKHSFRLISTRVYHSGKHELELQINGKKIGKKGFSVKSIR